MHMTRKAHEYSRPAASGAGRAMAHAMLVIALVIGVVFTHGGACAAVELAEPARHSVHVHERASEPAVHGGGCLHSSLPEHHRHGTEQDCSASAPASSTSYMAMPVALPASAPRTSAEAPSSSAAGARLTAPCPKNLCVMRI
jgi:hypothetical protein